MNSRAIGQQEAADACKLFRNVEPSPGKRLVFGGISPFNSNVRHQVRLLKANHKVFQNVVTRQQLRAGNLRGFKKLQAARRAAGEIK